MTWKMIFEPYVGIMDIIWLLENLSFSPIGLSMLTNKTYSGNNITTSMLTIIKEQCTERGDYFAEVTVADPWK